MFLVALFSDTNDDRSLPPDLQPKNLESKRACEKEFESFSNKEIGKQERKNEQQQQHEMFQQLQQKKKLSELVEIATATAGQENELTAVCNDCKSPGTVINKKGAEVTLCLFIFFCFHLLSISVVYIFCFCLCTYE
jgi:hypothetical protein